MARRRPNSQSSVYISTNPLNNVPIGTAGVGVAIGRLGILLFSESEQSVASPISLESTGNVLVLESAANTIVTEGV